MTIRASSCSKTDLDSYFPKEYNRDCVLNSLFSAKLSVPANGKIPGPGRQSRNQTQQKISWFDFQSKRLRGWGGVSPGRARLRKENTGWADPAGERFPK